MQYGILHGGLSRCVPLPVLLQTLGSLPPQQAALGQQPQSALLPLSTSALPSSAAPGPLRDRLPAER